MRKEVYTAVMEKIDALEGSAVCFPDGSVDTYHRVLDGHKGVLKDKSEMIERLRQGRSDFKLVAKRKEPGGVSVNMASQSSGLGLETRFFGHADDRVFDQLGFEINSLGAPAEVTVCEFDDGDVLFAKESQELLNWKLEDLSDDEALENILSQDLICCANWASIPSMKEELNRIIELEPDAELFNFDPGPLINIDQGRINELFEFLGLLDKTVEVVVHASTEELETVAEALDVEGSEKEKMRKIREKSGITAYVLHDKPKALAATKEEVYRVENVITENQSTFSGAGDRFSAAVGAAVVSGWDWKEALALGNICAVHYIEENSTAGKEDIRDQINSKLL